MKNVRKMFETHLWIAGLEVIEHQKHPANWQEQQKFQISSHFHRQTKIHCSHYSRIPFFKNAATRLFLNLSFTIYLSLLNWFAFVQLILCLIRRDNIHMVNRGRGKSDYSIVVINWKCIYLKTRAISLNWNQRHEEKNVQLSQKYIR